jgi:predicted ArsR family transcriptional regulator
MSTSDDHAQRAADKAAQLRMMINATKLRMMINAAKELKSERKNIAEIAEIMDISESRVRNLLDNDIEWGYNCLTQGVHHGRPEAIWNISLLYAATTVFLHVGTFKELVISRIYNDAMQIVEHNDKFDKMWADRVKELAEEKFVNTLSLKVGEITKYYDSPGWELEQQNAARLVTENRLNPGYSPLHPHDTINMLCRIIGVSASLQASSEMAK